MSPTRWCLPTSLTRARLLEGLGFFSSTHGFVSSTMVLFHQQVHGFVSSTVWFFFINGRMVCFHQWMVLFHQWLPRLIPFRQWMVLFHQHMVLFHQCMVLFHQCLVLFHQCMVFFNNVEPEWLFLVSERSGGRKRGKWGEVLTVAAVLFCSLIL